MGVLSYPATLTPGQAENVNDLNSNLTAIATVLNGGIDAANITAGTVTPAKMAAGITSAGKCIIATEEARTNVAYGTLTTPDQVAGIVLPTDGLLHVAFVGEWKESVANAAKAAIFIGANQLKLASNTAASPAVAETALGAGGTANRYKPLSTAVFGLMGNSANNTAYTGDVSTGQVLGLTDGSTFFSGRSCEIFAAAGTYTVSIQFKSTSGSVTAKNRKLWVWAMGF